MIDISVIAMKVKQVYTKLYSIYFTCKLQEYGAKVGDKVIFKRPIDLYYPQALDIGNNTIIHEFVSLKSSPKGRIKIGSNCKVNRFNLFNGDDIVIGNDVTFGPSVSIFGADHNFRRGALIRVQGGESKRVTIGNDCWIGANAVILKGGKESINSNINALCSFEVKFYYRSKNEP